MTNFRETYRGSVAAWECDQYGHMNVQFYTARISDAAASVMLAAGFGQDAFKVRKLGIAAVNAETRFVAELHAGDPIRMESGVTLAEGKKIKFHHRVYNAETGVLSMQADVLALCFDLEARKAVALPADLEEGFRRVWVDAAAPAGQVAVPPTEDGFLPTGRAPVQPWECDLYRHMNVQFYLARFAEAEKQVLLALGYGPKRRREDKVTVRPVRHHIQFRRENHEGAVLRLRTGIRKVEADQLHLCHELYEDETGTLSAVCEAVVVLDQLDTRGALALPADVRQAGEALAQQLRAPDAPQPQGGPPAPAAPVEGMYETCRGMVDRWQAEETGRMATRFYMARFSEAAAHTLAGVDLTAEKMREQGVGAAALDYVIDYYSHLDVGTIYHTRTAILELREKTWRFCHFLLDSKTEQPLARAEIVAVMFDTRARKSIPVPDHIRAAFTKRLLAPQPAE